MADQDQTGSNLFLVLMAFDWANAEGLPRTVLLIKQPTIGVSERKDRIVDQRKNRNLSLVSAYSLDPRGEVSLTSGEGPFPRPIPPQTRSAARDFLVEFALAGRLHPMLAGCWPMMYFRTGQHY